MFCYWRVFHLVRAANGVVSERLRTLGGSEFIIAAMRNHSSDARLQEMACLALGSLAFCSGSLFAIGLCLCAVRVCGMCILSVS